MTWRRSVAGLALVLSLGGRAGANQANYQQYLVGDRAPGMGGAACATADGADACFYNPAGLARVSRTSLSVTANLYGYQRYVHSDLYYPGEGIDAKSFVSIPSTMSAVYRLDDGVGLGLSAFVPGRYSFFGIQAFPTNGHFYSYAREDQTLYAGPSVGWSLSPRWSVGASVFAVYRTLNDSVRQHWRDTGDIYMHTISLSSLGALVQAGTQCRLSDRWKAGLTVQSPSVRLGGNGELEQQSAAGGLTQGQYISGLAIESRIPAKVSVGLAWEQPRGYALALDVTQHFSQRYALATGRDNAGRPFSADEVNASVTDVNVGAEYYLADRYPVRAGYFVSASSAEKQRAETAEDEEHIDLNGITLSVGREAEDVSVNVGVNYVFGSGTGSGIGLRDGQAVAVPVEVRERYFYVFVNTAFMF